MNNPHTQEQSADELYLKAWDIEQAHSNKRWSITTFFLGISFAILGFSFTNDQTQVPLFVPYAAAIISYWFSYLLFVRLNDYTKFLRGYLTRLEESGQVSFSVQGETSTFMKSRQRWSTTKLLLYFGVFYTGGIIVLAIWLTL